MSEHTLLLSSLLIVLATLIGYLLTHGDAARHRNLPPGPPEDSWLGGHHIPPTHPWRYLEKLTHDYGDIYTLRLGRKRLFVLGRASSAHAVLEKQSAKSASRPRHILAGELLSDNKRTLLLPYGDRWRLFRKAMHETLNDNAAKQYEPIQEREARIAILHLGRMGTTGVDFQRIFHRYAAAVVMKLTYDYDVTTLDDPLVKSVGERGHALAMTLRPGASVLDRYPLLAYLPTPLNPWKRYGLHLRKLERSLFLGEVTKVRERMRRGECAPCFVSKLTERQEELGITDLELSGMAGSLFGAGSDTTASALSIFIMAVCRYPRVLKRLQREVDTVVGSDRMPRFEDVRELVYLRATVQEVLRWRPVSAGGFEHVLTDDVEYRGYVLPKGSAVVGPHWSISRDEEEYEDPDVFMPERFLDGRTTGPADDDDDRTQTQPQPQTFKGTWFSPSRGHVAFGFGRRICPGLNVAMRSLTINLACLAWAFDVVEPNNQPEKVDTFAFNSAANSHPIPFEARFGYRGEGRRGVVEGENREGRWGEVGGTM